MFLAAAALRGGYSPHYWRTDVLTDDGELTYRQIHPNYMRRGVPASNRFMPSAGDQNQLSVDRGSMLTAADSHAAYIALGLASTAVYGVSVGEFRQETIPTPSNAIAASEESAGNSAHALADYTAHADGRRRTELSAAPSHPFLCLRTCSILISSN